VANSNEYKTGYKKPPLLTRFKAGQSGNPKGRPKKPPHPADPGDIFDKIDNEEIAVEVDGGTKRLRKLEVHFRQLFVKAIRGDLAAARLIGEAAAIYFGPEALGPGKINWVIAPDHYFEPKTQVSQGSECGRSKNVRSHKRRSRIKEFQSPVSAGALFRQIAWEEILIGGEASNYKMPRWHAYVRQIYNMMLNKNHSATRLYNRLRRQFPGELPSGDPVTYIISESDAAL
jgi:hypothetical protein